MRKIFAFSILIFALSFLPFTVWAQNDGGKQNVVLPKDEVINKDYFASGNTVSLDGTVNGDTYLAGGNVVVNGTVNGDLLGAAGNIDIKGTVTGNIRVVAGNINVEGVVGRNASLAAGNINLGSNTNVKGSLAAAGGSLSVFGPVEKEANLAGGQITLGSKIGSDVYAVVSQLYLAPTATISGKLTYLSKNSASITQGATVSGKISQNIPRGEQPQETVKREGGIKSFLTFVKVADFILAAIIGILLIIFFPVYFKKTSDLITQRLWPSLGIGLLTVIVFPFIFMLLVITVIGIPIAFVLAFGLAIFFYLAKIFASFVIGQLIFKQFNREINLIWPFLVGLVIYFILTLIPIVGWIIAIIAGLIGLGAILIEEKTLYSELRQKGII